MSRAAAYLRATAEVQEFSAITCSHGNGWVPESAQSQAKKSVALLTRAGRRRLLLPSTTVQFFWQQKIFAPQVEFALVGRGTCTKTESKAKHQRYSTIKGPCKLSGVNPFYELFSHGRTEAVLKLKLLLSSTACAGTVNEAIIKQV